MNSRRNDTALKVSPITIRVEGFEYFEYDEITRIMADGNYSKIYHIFSNKPSIGMFNLAKFQRTYK